MLKTIKTSKEMRLDELIRHVRKNGIRSEEFVAGSGGASVYFNSEQKLSIGEHAYGEMNIDITFTVEVEEEITEDTKFETLLEINNAGELYHYKNTTISSMSGASSKYFHAIIDGKLQLIWEAE